MASWGDEFFDPKRFAAEGYPYEAWARMRREEPVARVDGFAYEPFWAVTRHADVTRISRDPETFCSAASNLVFRRDMLHRKAALGAALGSAWRSGILFQPTALRALFGAVRHAKQFPGAGGLKMLLNLDPPEHGDLRRILAKRFTVRGLAPFEPAIRALAVETVDGVVARAADPARRGEPFDFVLDVAARFPMAVVNELLGVPRTDFDMLFRWSNEIVGAGDEEYAEGRSTAETIQDAQLALFVYFARHLNHRRRSPGLDLVSQLAHARVGDRALTDFEILSYCFLLLLAGNETTRNATSGGMVAMLDRPELWRRLRAEPALLETAVDEIVRWSSPIVYFARTATREVELGGRTIRAGDRLALFYASANRDETVFADPDAFDPARSPNPHLAFGFGEHFCMGARLARLELSLLFGELLRRAPELEPAGPVARLASNFVGGVKHLPVRFRKGTVRN